MMPLSPKWAAPEERFFFFSFLAFFAFSSFAAERAAVARLRAAATAGQHARYTGGREGAPRAQPRAANVARDRPRRRGRRRPALRDAAQERCCGARRAARGATLEAPPCVVAVVSLGKRRARARS